MRSLWKSALFLVLWAALLVSSFPIGFFRSPHRGIGVLPFGAARIAESAGSGEVTAFATNFRSWALAIAASTSVMGLWVVPLLAKRLWVKHLKRFDRDVLGFARRRRKVLFEWLGILALVVAGLTATWLLKVPRWWILLLFFVVLAVAFNSCAYVWSVSWRNNRRLWEGR
jgi:hypothetical protein